MLEQQVAFDIEMYVAVVVGIEMFVVVVLDIEMFFVVEDIGMFAVVVVVGIEVLVAVVEVVGHVVAAVVVVGIHLEEVGLAAFVVVDIHLVLALDLVQEVVLVVGDSPFVGQIGGALEESHDPLGAFDLVEAFGLLVAFLGLVLVDILVLALDLVQVRVPWVERKLD